MYCSSRDIDIPAEPQQPVDRSYSELSVYGFKLKEDGLQYEVFELAWLHDMRFEVVNGRVFYVELWYRLDRLLLN